MHFFNPHKIIQIILLQVTISTPIAAQTPCHVSVTQSNGSSRCGTGAVILSGTASTGASLIWYTDQTGGSAVAVGDSFLTPALTDTTTYYVAASSGSVAHAGPDGPAQGTNWGSTNLNSYQIFNVSQALLLQSVTVFPTASGSITVALKTSTGSVLQQATFPITLANGNYSYVPLGGGSNTTIGSGVVLPLNFSIQPGTGYRLVQYDNNSTVVRNTAGVASTYYNTNVNGLTITGSWIGSSGSSLNYWYNFYDWLVATGDTTHCESTRVAVQAIIKPVPTVSAGPDRSICGGASVTLGSTGTADSYLWTTGATTSTISTAQAGTYWVRGTDTASGCSAFDTVVVTIGAEPMVASIAASVSGPLYTLSAVNAQNVTGYQWDFGDGATSTDTQPQHVFGSTGSVTVHLCVTNDCYTSCSGLTPANNSRYVSGTLVVAVAGIDEAPELSSLLLYPVPVSDMLHITSGDVVSLHRITATDVRGQIIAQSEATGHSTTIDTHPWPAGIYLLSILTDHGIAQRKVTIIR